MATFFCVAEVPPEILAGLTAEDFKKREASQVNLLEWSLSGNKKKASAILEVSKTTEDPELRRRVLAVLKDLSDLDYLSDGSGYIGITMREEALAPAEEGRPRFAIRIDGIMRNSPAARAGLKRGDLILGLDGETWHDPRANAEFANEISLKKPLSEVTLLVERGAAEPEEVKVILGRRPIEDLNQARESLQLLDEQARDRHFREWLKRQSVEGE